MDHEYYKYNGNGRIIIPGNDEIDKLPKDGGKYWNRLIFESSPYLLQHAANPVEWYPWSEEAFLKAKKLDNPIFLSLSQPHNPHFFLSKCNLNYYLTFQVFL